jgi:copper chaperone CopZ
MDTLTLKLRGMSCASCASNVEKAIQGVPGVEECNVNFGAEQATIRYNSKKTHIEAIQKPLLRRDMGHRHFRKWVRMKTRRNKLPVAPNSKS